MMDILPTNLKTINIILEHRVTMYILGMITMYTCEIQDSKSGNVFWPNHFYIGLMQAKYKINVL